MSKQITNTILMVRPDKFGYNKYTAESNTFQSKDGAENVESIQKQAKQEFDEFVSRLRGAGVEVLVATDPPTPHTPDAVFPNNWVSFHDNGTVILYPMYAPIRRLERQESVLETVFEKYDATKQIDYSLQERKGQFLEGTGSLILDRENRIAYACLSPRTSPQILDDFCEWAGYKKVVFTAVDQGGVQIYHTNVMMALGETFVVICLESIADAAERIMVIAEFERTNKTIIDLSFEQMNSFAGNMLQVLGGDEKRYLVMSEQAYKSLTTAQIQTIEQHTNILYSPIYTIEKYGGGSARCMMAEVFLPRK